MALTAAAPVAAQQRGADASARVLKSFEACRQAAGDAAQLACFKQATDQLRQEVEGKQVTILDREDVRRTRRSLFGFSLPKLKLFGGGDGDVDREEVKQVEATVARVRSLDYGKVSVTLEDDAVWQTTEPVHRRPRSGSKALIKRGAMGGYFMSFDGGRTVRGMRVN